jgi:CTP synthase (UTP-ammonia lyase)
MIGRTPPGASPAVRIGVLGDRNPDYPTHRELDAALGLLPPDVQAGWWPTDAIRPDQLPAQLDGLWLAPGTPYADDAAVLAAIGVARRRHLPFLGTCGGFQYAIWEYAREVAGVPDAAHAELDPQAERPVIRALPCSLVDRTRPVTPRPGTLLARICGPEPFEGSHWCNYGLAPDRVQALQAAGLVVGADAPDAGIEAVELPGHPFFLATLFQPQVGSAASGRLHPLLDAFAAAARTRATG